MTALATRTYSLREATIKCGYRRVNTMRELHLRTEEQRVALGHHYRDGAVHLTAARVDDLAKDLTMARAARGNWRVRNLGKFAGPRRNGTGK